MTTDSKTYKDSGEGGITSIRPNAWREREVNFSCGHCLGPLPAVFYKWATDDLLGHLLSLPQKYIS